MDTREREEMLQSLELGRDGIREALRGLSEREAARAATGGWSALECVEHLALVEEYLFGRIEAAILSDGSTLNEKRETNIRACAADRSTRIEAPDVARPRGRFGSLDEALRAFLAGRERTIRFVESFDGDPRARVTDHPMIRGPVNCYEILLMISAHPLRHAQQIAEIRAAVVGSGGE